MATPAAGGRAAQSPARWTTRELTMASGNGGYRRPLEM